MAVATFRDCAAAQAANVTFRRANLTDLKVRITPLQSVITRFEGMLDTLYSLIHSEPVRKGRARSYHIFFLAEHNLL
jgi:hypothetical protein